MFSVTHTNRPEIHSEPAKPWNKIDYAVSSITTDSKTILLVEDDSAHAELVIRTLQGGGKRRIIHLGDGEAALDYLSRQGDHTDPANSPTPDLILLDLRLPKVDGLEVLHQIKSSPELRRLPVVVLTTSDADRDVRSAYEAHANGYVVKPDEFPRFSQLMDDVGSFWLQWNHGPADGSTLADGKQ